MVEHKLAFKNLIVLTVLFFLIPFFAFSQTAQAGWQTKKLNGRELENFSALSESYGYIRYFYPNSSFSDLDWCKYLMYAINKVKDLHSDKELSIELKNLFSPICPDVEFTKDTMLGQAEILDPPYYIMEHKGVGSIATMYNGKNYSPVRYIEKQEGANSYKSRWCFRLNNNLFISFPMAIKKLPLKSKSFSELNDEINKIDIVGYGLKELVLKEKRTSYFYMQLDYRIADIIIRRNIIQHFYPYFKEDKLDKVWDNECYNAIQNVSLCKSTNEYYNSICKLISNVKDSHINVLPEIHVGKIGGYFPSYFPDINVGFSGDTCYVERVGIEYEESINPGDYVIAINSVPIIKVIEQRLGYVSASTRAGGLQKLSNGKLLESSVKDTMLILTIVNSKNETKDISVKTSLIYNPRIPKCFTKKLDNGLLYINICTDSCNYKNFVDLIPVFQQSKGVIFDVRGYPKYEFIAIISHFLKEKISLGNLLSPVITLPNQENICYKPCDKWCITPVTTFQNELDKIVKGVKLVPILINTPVVFLTNASTISFGESLMEMIKYYKVGTIIGEPTAGCNGDITRNKFPFGAFSMTYNKFLNRDGSQHHGVGVMPDIYCAQSISDFKDGKDTQLGKAKEYFYEMGSNNQ